MPLPATALVDTIAQGKLGDPPFSSDRLFTIRSRVSLDKTTSNAFGGGLHHCHGSVCMHGVPLAHSHDAGMQLLLQLIGVFHVHFVENNDMRP